MASPAIATVLWHNPADLSTELCRLFESPEGFALEGLVLIPIDDVPGRAEYRVEADGRWVTRRVHLRVDAGGRVRELLLARDGEGRWTIDGERRPELDGCDDVDLRVTPATNTLPLRRLSPGLNEIAEVRAAWVGFPGLEVLPSTQRYERVGDRAYRFRSGEFVADLVVDGAGLVLRYGDGYWNAIAHRAGR